MEPLADRTRMADSRAGCWHGPHSRLGTWIEIRIRRACCGECCCAPSMPRSRAFSAWLDLGSRRRPTARASLAVCSIGKRRRDVGLEFVESVVINDESVSRAPCWRAGARSMRGGT